MMSLRRCIPSRWLGKNTAVLAQCPGLIVDASIPSITNNSLWRKKSIHGNNSISWYRYSSSPPLLASARDGSRPPQAGDGSGRGISPRNNDGRVKLNKFGHRYEQVGGPITDCTLSEDDIHNLIRERMQSRVARDFQKADSILKQLRQSGVDVDDKFGQWRADGVLFFKESPHRVFRMKDCRTVEEAIGKTFSHLQKLRSHDISAFWAVVPHLLQRQRNAIVGHPIPDNQAAQLDSILARTLGDIETYDPRDLTTAALGLAKIIANVGSQKGHPEGSYHQILHNLLIGQNSAKMQQVFFRIAQASKHILHQFDDRCLGNFIYAYTLIGYVPEFEDGSTLFDHIGEKSIPLLSKFQSQSLSVLLWSHAKMEIPKWKLFEKAGDTIVSSGSLDSYSPQALSNILWSYATLDHKHPELFMKVANHIDVCDSLNEFDPQALSNIVWAYATAKDSQPKLFKRVADHIVATDNLHKFEPQSLSIIAWSYTTANESHPTLFKKFADHIISLDKLDTFKTQNYSNMVWAYATVGESHTKLFQKIANHIIEHDSMDRFNEQELTNIVWAYATAKERHSKLFKRVADHIASLESLDIFHARSLANIVWAYATTKESHPPLFQKVADAAMITTSDFNSQNIANFLWAYAATGQIDQNLFSSFTPAVKPIMGNCKTQELTNIAWAYAVANVDAPSLFNDDFIAACRENEDNFITEDQFQLHQWQLWQEELNSDVELPTSLKDKCYDAFISRVPTHSVMQNNVVSELSSLGLEPKEEVLTEKGYRLDAVVEINGEKIGIEVDGPSHFIDRNPTGSTLLKRRQVTELEGTPVVSVPYWEWTELGNDSIKRQQYLKSLLGLS